MRFYKNILLDDADVMIYEMFVWVKIEHDWMPKRCKGSDKNRHDVKGNGNYFFFFFCRRCNIEPALGATTC